MDNDKRPVPDLSEEKRQGLPAVQKTGDEDPMHGEDDSPEQVGDEEDDQKEALDAEESEGIAVACSDGRGNASETADNEDHEVPKNPLALHFRLGPAIAHPMPPSTYRRLPLRSRKQYKPTRFVAAGAAPARQRRRDMPVPPAMSTVAMNEGQGSTFTCIELDATVDKSSSDEIGSGTGAANAAASSSSIKSYNLPSRIRKQRRLDNFIPEEAEAEALAKARRSNMFLDRFLTSLLRVSPEQRPEWVRNMMEDDDRGQRPGDADGSRTASGDGPEMADSRSRILTSVAVLSAFIVLCVVWCVLFYTGQRTEQGHQKT